MALEEAMKRQQLDPGLREVRGLRGRSDRHVCSFPPKQTGGKQLLPAGSRPGLQMMPSGQNPACSDQGERQRAPGAPRPTGPPLALLSPGAGEGARSAPPRAEDRTQMSTTAQRSATSSALKVTPDALGRRETSAHSCKSNVLFFSRRPRSILGNASWQEAFKVPRPLDVADGFEHPAPDYEWVMDSMKGSMRRRNLQIHREMDGSLGTPPHARVTPHPACHKGLGPGGHRPARKHSSYEIVEILWKISL